MPGLQGGFSHSHEVPGVLWLGLYPGQVLPSESRVPDPVQQVGSISQEVARGRAPPGTPVQLDLAKVVQRSLRIFAVGGEDG